MSQELSGNPQLTTEQIEALEASRGVLDELINLTRPLITEPWDVDMRDPLYEDHIRMGGFVLQRVEDSDVLLTALHPFGEMPDVILGKNDPGVPPEYADLDVVYAGKVSMVPHIGPSEITVGMDSNGLPVTEEYTVENNFDFWKVRGDAPGGVVITGPHVLHTTGRTRTLDVVDDLSSPEPSDDIPGAELNLGSSDWIEMYQRSNRVLGTEAAQSLEALILEARTSGEHID